MFTQEKHAYVERDMITHRETHLRKERHVYVKRDVFT